MKKNIMYALVCCCMIGFVGCSDNIEDASSKHKYTESESPYLRGDTAALITKAVEFEVGHFETTTINLADYAAKFKSNMNMTVDQVINGLKDKSVVFYNINPTRNIWNKAATTKGSTGWYYNTAGVVCQESDSLQAMSLEIDTNAKTLKLNAKSDAKAGTVFSFNIGFAVNGTDYDNYVRFTFNVSVTDPSIILEDITIPTGDYSAYSLDLNDYASAISTCMGLSVSEFLSKLDAGNQTAGPIHMAIINADGVWDNTSNYTANPPGYWMNDKGVVCNWGATGFTLYAETIITNRVLNIGRAPGLASGNKYTISVGYQDTRDASKFFRFIITATLE